MIAARVRLGFKVMTLGCLIVGAALLAAGLLSTVAPLVSAFGRLDAPRLPAQAPDNSVRTGFGLTLAGVSLLEVAAVAALAWGGCSLYLRRVDRARQAGHGGVNVSAVPLGRAGRVSIMTGVLLLGAGAGIAGYLVGLLRSAPPPLTLPAANEVCFVVARAFNSQREEPDLAPFLLPPESFADFLAKFEPFTKTYDPVDTPPIGVAWISGCDNRTWLVEWYWNGKNSLEFSVDGVRYQHIAPELSDRAFSPDGGMQMDIFLRSLQRAHATRLSAPADGSIIQGQ